MRNTGHTKIKYNRCYTKSVDHITYQGKEERGDRKQTSTMKQKKAELQKKPKSDAHVQFCIQVGD